MRLPTSLRVALISALLALASNVLLVGFLYWRTQAELAADTRERTVEAASILGEVYRSGGLAGLRRAVSDSLASGDPQIVAGLFERGGARLEGNVAALPAGRPGYRTGTLSGIRSGPFEAGYIVRPLAGGGSLVIGRRLGEELSVRRTFERSVALAALLALLLGILCGGAIARYVGRRVRRIALVAESIERGDLHRRVSLSGSRDSFDELGGQINRMLDRIVALMDELRLLTDSLAHDLRSPVSRLRARVDAALATEDEAERDAMLAGALRDADGLMRILTTVLEIGRSEAMAGRDQFTELEPGHLLQEIGEMYEPLIEEAGATLSVHLSPDLPRLAGHRQLLAQALSNLLDNAINYGAAGSEICLFAEAQGAAIKVGVADRGPGIPPEDRAEARRRFGRLDASRSKAGAGLGLALVEAVAHLHGGELELADNGPGLRAALRLPLPRQMTEGSS